MCSCKCFTWFFKFFLRLCRFCYRAWGFSRYGGRSFFYHSCKLHPKKSGEFYTAIWNISHNLGGGIIAPIVSLYGFALAAFLGVSLADFMKHISISIIFMFLLFVLCLLAFMCFMQSKEVLKMKVWLILLKSMKCEGLKQKKSKL